MSIPASNYFSTWMLPEDRLLNRRMVYSLVSKSLEMRGLRVSGSASVKQGVCKNFYGHGPASQGVDNCE